MRYFKTNVVSDFRVADINKGGEGAPLVPIFHKNLILQKNFDLPVAVLNIGGVSNITIIKSKNDFLGFDTGPGNCLLDTWTKKNRKGKGQRERERKGEKERERERARKKKIATNRCRRACESVAFGDGQHHRRAKS